MGEAQDRELRFLMDRRRFLRVTGTAAAAAFLASCGLSGDSESSPTSGTAGSPSPSPLPPVGGPLNLYTWEGYDTAGDLTPWLKQNDIEVNVKYIAGPEEVATVLKGPGGDQWDISYGDNVVLLDYVDWPDQPDHPRSGSGSGRTDARLPGRAVQERRWHL